MDPLKTTGPILASVANFIDKYRLLSVFRGQLLLHDFSVGHDVQLVSLGLGEGLSATNIQRSYESNDAQSFRVDPEKGIVVVTVEGHSQSYMLVISTKDFITGSSAVEWKKSATIFPILSEHPPHVFHTYILHLKPDLREDNDGKQYTHVGSTVFDFSLYCRRAVDSPTLTSDYLPKGVMPYHSSFDLPRPLAAVNRGGFNSNTVIDYRNLFPTENGVLVVKVRIPVVAKRGF